MDNLDVAYAHVQKALETADKITTRTRTRMREFSAEETRDVLHALHHLAKWVAVQDAVIEAQGDIIRDAQRRAEEGMGICGKGN